MNPRACYRALVSQGPAVIDVISTATCKFKPGISWGKEFFNRGSKPVSSLHPDDLVHGIPTFMFNFLYFISSPLRNVSDCEGVIRCTTFQPLSITDKDKMIANVNSLLPTNCWQQCDICRAHHGSVGWIRVRRWSLLPALRTVSFTRAKAMPDSSVFLACSSVVHKQ